MPNERVSIALADGTTVELHWSSIRFVLDGDRIYDASGNAGRIPAGLGVSATAPPPSTTEPPLAAPPPPPAAPEPRTLSMPEGGPPRPAWWGRFRPPNPATPEQLYLAMPPRGWTTAFWIGSGLFVLTAVTTLGAVTEPCGPYDPPGWRCDHRTGAIVVGTSLGVVS